MAIITHGASDIEEQRLIESKPLWNIRMKREEKLSQAKKADRFRNDQCEQHGGFFLLALSAEPFWPHRLKHSSKAHE